MWSSFGSRSISDSNMTNALLYNATQTIWSLISSEEYRSARPKRGIAFLKTHKTGSSTIASVLHSIAISHNLATAIAIRAEWGENYTGIEQLPSTNQTVGPPFDIWTHHIHYDIKLLDKIVPTAEYHLVSIVRDPATHMRSACQYYGCCPSNPTKLNLFVLQDGGREQFAEKQNHCKLDESSHLIVGIVVVLIRVNPLNTIRKG